MSRKEAVFLPIHCINAHKQFYLRYDYSFDNFWVLSYGVEELPKEEGSAFSSSASAQTTITGQRRVGPQYRCPYCGNTDYVRCGKCRKLTCYSGSGTFHCDHCGNVGEVFGTIDTLDGESRTAQI